MIYILGLLVVALFANAPDHFEHQWQLGCLFTAFCFASVLWYRGYSLIVSAAWFYPAAWATLQFQHKDLGGSALGVFLSMLAIPQTAIWLPTETLWRFFRIFSVVNSLVMISRGGPGLLGNASLDATLVACIWTVSCFEPVVTYGLYPRAQRAAWYFMSVGEILAPLFALYTSRSSVGIAVAGVGAAIGLFRTSGPLRGILASLIAILIGQVTLGAGLFNDSGRYRMWALGADFFKMHANPWFGFGPGAWREIIPRLQLAGDERVSIWVQAHNDWLQLLFETGWIGLGLVSLLWADMLRRSWARPHLFAAWSALGFAALFNQPMHLFFGALFACLLVKDTIRGEQENGTHPGIRRARVQPAARPADL